MKCKKCGTSVTFDDRYCKGCNTPLATLVSQQLLEGYPNASEPASDSEKQEILSVEPISIPVNEEIAPVDVITAPVNEEIKSVDFAPVSENEGIQSVETLPIMEISSEEILDIPAIDEPLVSSQEVAVQEIPTVTPEAILPVNSAMEEAAVTENKKENKKGKSVLIAILITASVLLLSSIGALVFLLFI